MATLPFARFAMTQEGHAISMNMPPKVSQFFKACLSSAHFPFTGTALAVCACVFAPPALGQTTGPIAASPTQTAPAKSTKDTSKSTTTNPNFAGIWKLNKDQSDDPRKAIQKAMGNSGGQRSGGWGMGGHGGYGGRRGGGGQDQDRDSGNSNSDMTDFSRLTIDQTDLSTKVTGATGRILAQYSANDADATKGPGDGSYTPPAAQWKDDQLVVVTQGNRGAKTTRTYSLSPDRKQLNVATRIENPRFKQPVTFRFIYDPVKPESSNPSK